MSNGLLHDIARLSDEVEELQKEVARLQSALSAIANAGDDCDMDGRTNWTGLNGYDNPKEFAISIIRGEV